MQNYFAELPWRDPPSERCFHFFTHHPIAIRLQALATIVILAGVLTAAPYADWVRMYAPRNEGHAIFNDLYHTSDGGFVMAGQAELNRNMYAYWLVKTDSDGQTEFNRTYRPGNWLIAECFSVIQCDDGGFLMGGRSSHDSLTQVTIIRTDAQGEILWWFVHGNDTHCWAVIELKSGDYLACGREFVGQSGRAYALKFNDQGDIIWERRYENGVTPRFWAVREVDDGYMFAGLGENHGWIVRTDTDGRVVWQNEYNTGQFYGLISCRDGGFAAVGGMRNRIGLLRFDIDGNRIWERQYGGANSALTLAQSSDLGFFIAGSNDAPEVLRVNQSGDSL